MTFRDMTFTGLRVLAACFILALPVGDAMAEPSAPLVSDVVIHLQGAADQDEALERLARNLITVKKGRPFDPLDLKHSLNALKDSGVFREIRIPDPDFSKQEITLDVYLTLFDRIRDIRIHNAFPLMEKSVKRAMRLYAGDRYVPKPFLEKEESVKALYRKSGYPNTEVILTADESGTGDGVVISVWIEKGPYYKVNDVRLTGNSFFSSFRLKLRTDIYKTLFLWGDGRRFIQEKLDDDIKNLTRFYKDHGFPDIKITPEVTKNDNDYTARIMLRIDEGPRYVVSVEGNEEYWDWTLKRMIDFSRTGASGDLAVKRAVRAIRDRYRKAGYPRVFVDLAIETVDVEGREEKQVKLIITEGPRSRIRELNLEGNRSIPDKILKKQMLTTEKGWFDPGAYEAGVLDDDREAVKMVYRNHGFLDPDVETELTWEKDEEKNNWGKLTVHVEEGTRTRVESIRFSGLSVMDDNEALSVLALEKNGPYSEKMMREDETALSAAISEKGYPRVTVTGTGEFVNGKEAVRVLFTVDTGPYMAMGDLVILGNYRTRASIIEREMNLKKDDPFSLRTFLESQKNIRDINALDGANFNELGLSEKRDRVDLVVETREKKPYYIEGATGYDTRRHAYVRAKVGDRNLLGLNKEGWVSCEFSEIGYKAESAVTEPRFLDTRISATLNVFSEEEEELNKYYGTRTHGASLALGRDFLTHYNAGLAFRYEYLDQYKVGDEEVSDEDIEFYEGRRRVVTSPSIIYNSTDSFIRPRKGLYTYCSVDLSKGLGDAPDEFLKYNAQANYYYSPLSFLTLAFRCRYGYIQPTGGFNRVPDDQLFFLGGTSDVRGYDENMLRYDPSGDPVGGREMTMGGFEIRTDIGRRWELTTFFDTGRIRKTQTGDGSDRFRSSVGAGLRYVTPIGPIGLLYGIKLDPDENEDPGQWHFTLGYSF